MSESSTRERGYRVAATLAGAWRDPVPRHDGLTPAALAEIAPLLLASGGSGLGWRAVRDLGIAESPAGQELRKGHRVQTLAALRLRHSIARAFAMLRSEGIEPLLAKGWAIARLYPEPGLRPCGDVDLCVRPEEHATAAAVLVNPSGLSHPVDLHRGFVAMNDRGLNELYARSQLIPLDGASIRVLGPEDHLRYLALHMLSHGAWRPLWLCDIAVAIESRPPDFDWDYFLSGNARRTEWASCVVKLAHQLLDADLTAVPARIADRPLPRWLAPAVVRQWGTASFEPQGSRTPLAYCLRNDPAGLPKALAQRWPNPVEATVGVRGPFNDLPRLPFQLGELALRAFGLSFNSRH